MAADLRPAKHAHYHHLYTRNSNYHPGEVDSREKDLLTIMVVQRGIGKKTTINIYIKSMPIISYIWQEMRTGSSHVQNGNAKINFSSTSLMYTQQYGDRKCFTYTKARRVEHSNRTVNVENTRMYAGMQITFSEIH